MPSRMEKGIDRLQENCSPLNLVSGDIRFISKGSSLAMALNETVECFGKATVQLKPITRRLRAVLSVIATFCIVATSCK